MTTQPKTATTVVLVHAAWADGSSWSKVIAGLQREGINTASVQLPLTSLSEDIEAVRRVLGRLEGPAIVVGHSYGGAPMTAAATGICKVKGLVFVAAMAPDEGETVGDLLHRATPHPLSAKLAPDSEGFIWMSTEGFANSVAPNATSDEIALMATVQKPIALRCIGEAMTKPAWRERPSWFLVAEDDRQIVLETQRFMAERMNARLDVRKVDHSPNVTAPELVVSLIRRAIEETDHRGD
jgi:pimeloyl-ACP methyl ester carboxylesterase